MILNKNFKRAHLIVLVVERLGPFLCQANHHSPIAIIEGRLKLEVDAVFEVGSLLTIH